MRGDNILKQHKEFNPIILPLVLFLVALLIFFVFNGRVFPNMNLWIPIFLYILIDIGFMVLLILGVRSKNKTVKVFSILLNIELMILLSICIFLLLLANGISEP